MCRVTDPYTCTLLQPAVQNQNQNQKGEKGRDMGADIDDYAAVCGFGCASQNRVPRPIVAGNPAQSVSVCPGPIQDKFIFVRRCSSAFSFGSVCDRRRGGQDDDLCDPGAVRIRWVRCGQPFGITIMRFERLWDQKTRWTNEFERIAVYIGLPTGCPLIVSNSRINVI